MSGLAKNPTGRLARPAGVPAASKQKTNDTETVSPEGFTVTLELPPLSDQPFKFKRELMQSLARGISVAAQKGTVPMKLAVEALKAIVVMP